METAEKLITENLDVWTSAVKAKSSAGRGSSKKRELYGIQKLRELILELAIRGLLVPQNDGDEHAESLLKSIAKERARLLDEGGIRKPKPLPPVSEEDQSFNIPEGWVWTQLGEIAEIGPRNTIEDSLKVAFVPMPLVTTSYRGDHGQETRLWSEVKKGYTHFADGDIALAKITPCFENSKAAIFQNLTNGHGAGTTELHVARPYHDFVDSRFVLLYLKAPMFLERGKPKMTGSAGQKRIPASFFIGNPLPLPPLAEQHRIVAKVDELMALCDQLEQEQESSLDTHDTLVATLLGALTTATADASQFAEAWQRIQANFDTLFTTESSIDQLKQTILQLAVMGKLVPQDSEEAPAAEFLQKIANERNKLLKAGKIKKPKPPVSFAGLDELRRTIPEEWEWVRLSTIAEIVRGGSPRPAGDPRFYDGDIPFLKVGDITNNKGKFVEGHTFTIKEAGLKKTRFITERTVLLSNSGATLGIPSICEFPATFNDGIAAFVEKSEFIYDEYLYLCLKNLSLWFLTIASRGQGQPNLNTDIIKAAWIPLPPLKEQEDIVAKVDELMAQCDQLKASLATAQATQLNLADSLVEQAIG